MFYFRLWSVWLQRFSTIKYFKSLDVPVMKSTVTRLSISKTQMELPGLPWALTLANFYSLSLAGWPSVSSELSTWEDIRAVSSQQVPQEFELLPSPTFRGGRERSASLDATLGHSPSDLSAWLRPLPSVSLSYRFWGSQGRSIHLPVLCATPNRARCVIGTCVFPKRRGLD